MQPLTKTIEFSVDDKNIGELMAAAAERSAENKGWATDIISWTMKMQTYNNLSVRRKGVLDIRFLLYLLALASAPKNASLTK